MLGSYIGPKVGLCAKFQLDWLIGDCARECDGQTPPCENRANSGTASLVPGPELSNLWYLKEELAFGRNVFMNKIFYFCSKL